MKKRVWKGKRLFSLLLAFVMLASIMPLELLVGAISPREEPADISVVMSADPEKVGLSGSSTVTLKIEMNTDKITEAYVEIQFPTEENVKIVNPFWETEEVNPLSEEDTSGEGETRNTYEFDSSSKTLKITVREDSWSERFTVQGPEGEGVTDPVEFVIGEGNITVTRAMGVGGSDGENSGETSDTVEELQAMLDGKTAFQETGDVAVLSAVYREDDAAGVEATTGSEDNTGSEPGARNEDNTPIGGEGGVSGTSDTQPGDGTPTSGTPNIGDEGQPDENNTPAGELGDEGGDNTTGDGTTGDKTDPTSDGDTGDTKPGDGAAGGSQTGGNTEQEINLSDLVIERQGVTVTFTNQEEAATLDFSKENVPESITVTEDRTVSDFDFTFNVALGWHPNYEGASTAFRLDLTLPDGMFFPDGEVSEKDGGIFFGATQVLNVNLPNGAEITEGITYEAEANTLSIPVTQSVVSPTEGVETVTRWSYPVTVTGAALTLAPSFSKGNITLGLTDTTSDGTAETVPETIEVSSVTTPPVEGEIEEEETVTKQIIWVDNKDEYSFRPETTGFPETQLYFTINDGERTPLNTSTMGRVGLTQMPQRNVQETGVGVYTLSYDLPKTITVRDENGTITNTTTIDWDFGEPPEVSGYQATNVTDHEAAGVKTDGWYYVLEDSFTMTVDVRWGTLGSADGISDAILQALALYQFEGSSDDGTELGTLYSTLHGLANGQVEGVETQIEIAEGEDPKNPTRGTWTVSGMPRYKLDGTLISYRAYPEVDNIGYDENNMILKLDSLEEGDYFKITFDNSSVPNHNSDTDAIYSGGELILTLAGTTKYTATKVWLDEGENANRPTATYQLYRYLEGEDAGQASPVYWYTTGEILTAESTLIPMPDGENSITWGERYTLSLPENIVLDKYNQDGYKYVYCLRETMSGDNAGKYQQVFGEVNRVADGDGTYSVQVKDKLPENYYYEKDGETVREENYDYYIYDEGYITNRRYEAATVDVEKSWEAASFQGELTHVQVTLSLQSRPKGGDSNNQPFEWTDTGITVTKTGFTEEDLHSWTSSATANKYGNFGREAEFRWVESEIAIVDDNGNFVEDVPLFPLDYDETTGIRTATFTLDGTTFESEVVYDKDGHTKITNSVADNLDYEVTKVWKSANVEGHTPKAITINLYQVASGQSLADLDGDTTPYLSFEWNGEEITWVEEPEDSEIKFDQGVVTNEGEQVVNWDTIIRNLPKYDENGGAYEYILLEQIGENDSVPEYETDRDENGNYHTTVINGPGKGRQILVRKDWIDDSDVTHRGDVTIQAFEADNSTPASDKIVLEDDVWFAELNIYDSVGDAEVYILELEVGGVKVPTQPYIIGNPQGASPSYEPADPGNDPNNVYQYETDYHRYEATYSETKLAGQTVYVVTNRRLGNIDLTATKVWNDGENLREALADAINALPDNAKITPYLELHFASDAEEAAHDITYGKADGDTVILDGKADDGTSSGTKILNENDNPTQARQEILLKTEDLNAEDQEFYFHNLPKYDKNGAVVHYEIQEVWIAGNERITEPSELKAYFDEHLTDKVLSETYTKEDRDELLALLDEFSFNITSEYHAGRDEGKDVSNDTQTVTVTNGLSNTKRVVWEKQWYDDFTVNQGQRPDLYLDIYRATFDESGVRTVELVRANYLMQPGVIVEEPEEPEPGSGETQEDARSLMTTLSDDGGQTSPNAYDPNHWTVTMENAAKYDGAGYEYIYYAVERTQVNFADYDYQLAQYEYDVDGDGKLETLGDRDTISDEYLTGENSRQNLVLDLKANTNLNLADDYPRYALREGGTIVNSLDDEVVIQGQKIWKSLPDAYPDVDLPAVTFNLYQTYDGTVADNAERVAWLTVDKWASAKVNGTYVFQIEYLGENVMTVEADGTVTVTGEPLNGDTEPTPLPRYDGEGRLYTYVVREEIATAEDGADTAPFKVEINNGTFVATNSYNSEKGDIHVKKILKLPSDLLLENPTFDDFPAVKFVLTRQYWGIGENETQELKDDTGFRSETFWSSTEVKEAYKAAVNENQGDTVTFTSEDINGQSLVFTGLEKYAPNGSPYFYTVTEVKEGGEGQQGFLYGFDTYAKKGKLEPNDFTEADKESVEVENLIPISSSDSGATQNDGGDETGSSEPIKPVTSKEASYWATFQNVPAQEYITIEGTKEWTDFHDAFGVRPDDITLTLYRSADTQPGENNGILEEAVPKDEYKVEWDVDSKRTDTWKYTITSTSETESGFPVYAPNGMPWKYTVKESTLSGDQELNQIYRGNPWTVTKQADKENDGILTMDPLRNSTEASVQYKKAWIDANGNPITEDFLNQDLTVKFKVQVREKSADGTGVGNWSDADKYFREKLKDNYETIFPPNDGVDYFTRTLTGKLDDTSQWNCVHEIDNLPVAIKRDWTEEGGTEDTSGAESSDQPQTLEERVEALDLIFLEYRVVETSVTVGDGETQTITSD